MTFRKPVSIYGIPASINSSFHKGCAHAPEVIRDLFYNRAGNSYTEDHIDLAVEGTLDFKEDLPIIDFFDDICSGIETGLRNGERILSLGGDHSITFPIMEAYHKFHPGLAVLQIDAHPDLYENFDNNPLSHASPFARIMERKIIGRLVQVGIRASNEHLRQQAERFGVEVYTMENWRSFFDIAFDGPLYLSIDLDGIDPGFAPGVSHPEPGGLSVRDVISIIQSIKVPVIGADIVELNPDLDVNNLTTGVAVKIMKELAGKILRNA
jgi:agmatinase